MHAVLYPALAGLAWFAFGYRLLDLRRGHHARNPARYAVCAALALLAVVFTVSTPTVWALLDRATGVPNLAALTAHLCVVGFGATVELEEEDSGEQVRYQIVGEDEADLKQGLINISSPIARALIGKEEGDTAEVQAPGGTKRYEIVAVNYL